MSFEHGRRGWGIEGKSEAQREGIVHVAAGAMTIWLTMSRELDHEDRSPLAETGWPLAAFSMELQTVRAGTGVDTAVDNNDAAMNVRSLRAAEEVDDGSDFLGSSELA